MKVAYSLEEKVNERNRRGPYVSVTGTLSREGEKGFNPTLPAWQRFETSRNFLPGTTLYLVGYIEHDVNNADEKLQYFTDEETARKYLRGLASAIANRDKNELVDIHYDQGNSSVRELLDEMPPNTYVGFKTPKTYSVTFIKTRV